MRHWNSSLYQKFGHFVVLFLLYLWGIETNYYFFAIQFRKILFLLYLWGIETGLMIVYTFYFTLFLLYLWGIETNL